MELADCGHVFEVEMMDHWMDQAQASDDGKAVDVQLKRCPKCLIPIRTSLRYGNIIKKILADFEKIKEKILLGNEQRAMEVNRLILKVQEIEKFPEDKDQLQRMLVRKSLTSEQVNVFENQINVLSFLQTIKAKIEKCIDAESGRAPRSVYLLQETREDVLLQETREDVESLVEQLRKRVMELRDRFSDQELEELSEEMYRTKLAVDFKLLKMQLQIRSINLGVTHSMKVGEMQKALDSERKIGKSL